MAEGHEDWLHSITRGWATGGNTAGTNLTDGTGEAKLNIAHLRPGSFKIKQEVTPTVRPRQRHASLTIGEGNTEERAKDTT